MLSGKYLERVWGQWPFLQFVAVTVIGSNIMAVAVNVLEHFVLADTGVLLCVLCEQHGPALADVRAA